MIHKQHSLARRKKATSKFKLFVYARKHFACILNVTLLAMFFLFASGCTGEDKSSQASTNHNYSYEESIAARLYSYFYADEVFTPDDIRAELIADEVLHMIIHAEPYSGYDTNDSEHKHTVDAIYNLLYNSNYTITNDTAASVAKKMMEQLGHLQNTFENIPFVMSLTTDGLNKSMTFQTYSLSLASFLPSYRMHYSVDCGNGTAVDEIKYINNIRPSADVEHTCTYAQSGGYQISITQHLTVLPIGLPQLRITAGGQYLSSINQWGSGQWLSMYAMFEGVTSDFTFPDEAPLTAQLQSMSKMFDSATSFNQPLNGWDVSSVMNMYQMFNGASSFNQPLNGWDVSSVMYMGRMFHSASNFNQPLNGWDVSSVMAMFDMFNGASSFNQPLNGWDVSSVTDMRRMFNGASSFNQPLNGWDVSSVTNMDSMFYGASSFNQSLNEWDSIKHPSLNFNNILTNANAFDPDNCTWCP